ncbi:MAG: hypothetical protein PHY92_06915 [Alphaproteobacteria bacterium]|nr:hypothetical protein [Alphaproteobacteria bacterium]
MKTITQTKAAAKKEPAPSMRVPALLIVLACIVLASAVPSLAARVAMLPGNAVRDALLTRGTAPDDSLKSWAATRMRALSWRAMADVYNDLALYALAQARRAGVEDGASPQKAWREALRWQGLALGRSPVDTFGWTRLAYMMMQTEGLTDATASALTHSFETGPYEPSLQTFRLVMAVSMLDKLAPDMKDSMPFMIRAAWEYDSSSLAKAAYENHFISLVEQALADNPEYLEDFRGKISAFKAEDKAPSTN